MTEKISALVDNACDETESRRVVEEVLSSADAKLQWQRYHLVSALMRGECSDVGLSKGRDDLASKVMEQIADDPPWLLPARKRSASKRRAGQLPAMASGFAVAATLAVVGFVGWQSGFLSRLGARGGVKPGAMAVRAIRCGRGFECVFGRTRRVYEPFGAERTDRLRQVCELRGG